MRQLFVQAIDEGDIVTQTFQRKRSIARWGVTRWFESPAAFLRQPVVDGLQTIQVKGRNLDILVRNRHSDTTLIVFHGALSRRQRTIPVLSGEGIAEFSGVNLVACADPSLDMGPLSCGWFLGDEGIGRLRPILSPVIKYALEQIGSKRSILFGGSGGGYAAVNFAQDFEGSVALAMNPRLNLAGTPASAVPEYLRVCHGSALTLPENGHLTGFYTPNLVDDLNQKQEFDLLLLQNANDSKYLNRQIKPFVANLEDKSRTWISLVEGPPGHKPLSKEIIRHTITNIASAESLDNANYLQKGFKTLDE